MSYGTFLPPKKTMGQLWTVTKCFTRTFVIARHMCYRCLYPLVTVIFAVVACTITFFIKTYLLSLFLVIFLWLWKFHNQVIFISTSKSFPRRTFCLSIAWSINCTRFFLFLSYHFGFFSAEWFVSPQNVYFFWTAYVPSLFLPKPELLSRFR